jgi:predicted RNA-binding protein
MNTLIIHPKDESTDVLKYIYSSENNYTVINGQISKIDLYKLIQSHFRTIFIGHGTSRGLSNINMFKYKGEYIIDYKFKNVLERSNQNIYLWCYADRFVKNNALKGIFTGMFISDLQEAKRYNIANVKKIDIDASNIFFSQTLANCINKNNKMIYNKLILEYALFAKDNKIAKFNVQNIFIKH